MNSLTIKLKQHTPIIHFQHNQDGATLRATEVKPKLDRFILTKLGGGCYEKGREKAKEDGWLVGKGEHGALDYKMRIEGDEKTKKIILSESIDRRWDSRNNREVIKYSFKYRNPNTNRNEEFPFLLSNMGGKEQKEELVNLVIYDILNLKIFSLNDKLSLLLNSAFIKEELSFFFAVNNFGQRSSKGFGSFSVISFLNEDKNEWETVNWIPNNYYEDETQYLMFSLNAGNCELEKQKLLFSTLDFYWKVLKSGINVSRRRPCCGKVEVKTVAYIKAFLWVYLNKKGSNWEKRKIKTHFSLETPHPVRTILENTNEPTFARALLGCPLKYEYRIPTGKLETDRNGREKERVRSIIVDINHYESIKEKLIERIESPIILKPIVENDVVRVYVLIKNSVLNELKKHDNLTYKFDCSTNEPTYIDIDVNSIDYKDLIVDYHQYLWEDNGALIFKDTKISKEDQKLKFIPRDFSWNNILGKNEENENLVSMLKIKKL